MKTSDGKYEIRRYDSRNLELIEHTTKTIKSQMIADKINQSDQTWDCPLVHVGDEYPAEVHRGYFPVTDHYLAFNRLYGLLIEDGVSKVPDLSCVSLMLAEMRNAKEEIKEMVKGVEV